MKSLQLISVLTAYIAGLAFSGAAAALTKSNDWQQVTTARYRSTGHRRVSVSQVATDLRNARWLQARGEITAARNFAIRAWIGANVSHSIPVTSPSLNPVLLFPERDALHFFAWNTATELVYIDLSRGTVELAWRASFDPLASISASTKANAPYAFVRDAVVIHEDGVRPVITKPLVYFEVEYDTLGGLLYGRAKQSGDFIAMGRDALTWHHDGISDGDHGSINNVNGRWVAWPKVRSIPGERDDFAGLDRQAARPVAVSNAGKAFAQLAHQYLAKGDLTAARNAALAAWSRANIAGSVAGGHGATLEEVYLFPEGQALRFFDWCVGVRITYIEIREDAVAFVWAADLGGDDRRFVVSPQDDRMVPWPSNLLPHFPFTFASGSMMTLEVGHRPDVGDALVFFDAEYATGGVPFGRVADDGRLHPTAETGLRHQDGHVVVVPIPGERMQNTSGGINATVNHAKISSEIKINPKDGAVMVLIPAGAFQIGPGDLRDDKRRRGIRVELSL